MTDYSDAEIAEVVDGAILGERADLRDRLTKLLALADRSTDSLSQAELELGMPMLVATQTYLPGVSFGPVVRVFLDYLERSNP